jgi:two-component system response regulator YesN
MSDTLKVLIVDDEQLIRNLLKMRIKWEELGFEITGEAASAREALILVEELVPDIIFTDICMPFMDGIEFSRLVIEKFPHIKIVIITGHEEFDYAKKSVKLGISDFILKPINAQEIKNVALSLKEKIFAERTHIKEYEALKQQLEENLPYLREKFLNELLQGELDKEEIRDKMEYFKISKNIVSEVFQVAVAEVSETDKVSRSSEEDRILLSMQCMDLVKKFFHKDNYINIFFDNSRKIVILFNDSGIDSNDCCEMLKTLIINRYKCFVNIGIGTVLSGVEKIKISYKEACEALNYKVVVGKNQVVSYGDINFSGSHSENHSDKFEKLSFFIKAGLTESALDILEQLFSSCCYEGSVTINKPRLNAFDILTGCQHIIMDMDIDTSDIWGYNTQPYSDISRIDNLPELKNYMISMISKIIDKIKSLNDSKASKLVKQIQEYINVNLDNCGLSLPSVAKEFFISPSHLSRLFKQEANQTLIEYITKTRIKKAEKLLKETELKGYQIGEMVGIDDPHYFSILFKKYTGLSINDYRKV